MRTKNARKWTGRNAKRKLETGEVRVGLRNNYFIILLKEIVKLMKF